MYPGALDDNNPVERDLGIRVGFELRRIAHKTVVYQDLGISGGMALGIRHAEEMKHEIVYRMLPDYERWQAELRNSAKISKWMEHG